MQSEHKTTWYCQISLPAIIAVIALCISLISLFISFLVFDYQKIQDKKEMHYSTFIKTLEYEDSIREKGKEKWLEKKDELLRNPENRIEDINEVDALGYLLLKLEKDESMDITDFRLFEIEIRSLNLLNELCRIAKEDKRMEKLLKLTYSSNIAYCQQEIDNLLKIYESVRKIAIFSKPQYEHLQEFEVVDFVDL